MSTFFFVSFSYSSTSSSTPHPQAVTPLKRIKSTHVSLLPPIEKKSPFFLYIVYQVFQFPDMHNPSEVTGTHIFTLWVRSQTHFSYLWSDTNISSYLFNLVTMNQYWHSIKAGKLLFSLSAASNLKPIDVLILAMFSLFLQIAKSGSHYT